MTREEEPMTSHIQPKSIQNQVVSLELSKRLKELGVPQESQFYWRLEYHTSESFKNGISTGKKGEFGDYHVTYLPKPRYTTADVKWNERDLAKLNETEVSAFLVGELGEMLPEKVKSDDIFTVLKHEKHGKFFRCIYYQKDIDEMYKYLYQTSGLSEADARARMLIYLIENNLIKASDL